MVTLQYYVKTFIAVFPQKFERMQKIWTEKQQLESEILKALKELKKLDDAKLNGPIGEYGGKSRQVDEKHDKLRVMAFQLVNVIGRDAFFSSGNNKQGTLRHTTSKVLGSLQTINTKKDAIMAEVSQQNAEMSNFFRGFFGLLPNLITYTDEFLKVISKKGDILRNYSDKKPISDFEFTSSYAFWSELEKHWIERIKIKAIELRALRKEVLAIVLKQFRKQKDGYYDRDNYFWWFVLPLLIIDLTGLFMLFAKPDMLQEYFKDHTTYVAMLGAALFTVPAALSAVSKTIRDVTFTITGSIQELAS